MIATGTPKRNCQVECSIINNMLTTTSDFSEWPSVLCKIQQSLNTTVQKSIGFTPTRLLIGCNGHIPPMQARLDDIQDSDSVQDIDAEADGDLARQRLREAA